MKDKEVKEKGMKDVKEKAIYEKEKKVERMKEKGDGNKGVGGEVINERYLW